MSNVSKLKKMINLLAENSDTLDKTDNILAYLASIATSLAVIADKLTEGDEEE